MGFVDLHSHVLPGLDDGSKSLEDSLELVKALSALGFDQVCATPHQRVDLFVPSRAEIDDAYVQVRSAIAIEGLGVELLLGAENFWDELFFERAQNGKQPLYTGEKAFLFELHVRMLPPNLENALFHMRVKGHLPVLAHPERYMPLWDNLGRYETLRSSAALVVDLGALVGAHGENQRTAARKLLERGWAHAVTTDVHSLADLTSAHEGMRWIEKELGQDRLVALCDKNPRAILRGELPE